MKKVLFLFQFLGFSLFCFGQNSNTSIKFNGGDVLTFPLCEGLTGPSFTIEGWIKSAPSSQLEVIAMAFQDDLGYPNANVTLEIRNAGLLRFNYRGVALGLGGDEIYSKTVIQDNTWHHFAAIKDDNQKLLLYIDGFLESFSCFNLQNISTAPTLEMGRNKFGGGSGTEFRWLIGSVDDFKIWRKSKTAKEVYEGFRRENGGNEPLLYSNYKFDITSDTIYDCSLYERHGIRQNVNGVNQSPQFSTNIPVITDVDCFQNFTTGTEEQIKEVPKDNAITLFPNPANNVLEIQFLKPTDGIIVIFNSLGQVVLSDNLLEKITEKEITIANLPNGNYVLHVITATSNFTKKFEKVK